jgi:hypothetical protein
VHLLSAINRLPGYNNASGNTVRVVFSLDNFLNYGERRIVWAIGNEDHFVRRIVLLEERRDIISQTIFQTAAGSNNRSERREIRKETGCLAPDVGSEAKTTAKRRYAQPDYD